MTEQNRGLCHHQRFFAMQKNALLYHHLPL
jgi:hypothetical protein